MKQGANSSRLVVCIALQQFAEVSCDQKSRAQETAANLQTTRLLARAPSMPLRTF